MTATSSEHLQIGYLPGSMQLLENELFSDDPQYEGRNTPFIALRNALQTCGHTLETLDDIYKQYDVLFIQRIDVNSRKVLLNLSRFPRTKLVYFVTEEVAICPMHALDILMSLKLDAILTWIVPSMIENNIISYAYPNATLKYDESFCFSKRKLLVAIAANKSPRFFAKHELYTFRRKLFTKLLSCKGFKLAGGGWNVASQNSHRYLGLVECKSKVLQQFRYSLVIENSQELGGVTEKIFDSMANGCVPIYKGAPDVENWIPKSCFIALEDIEANDICEFLSAIPQEVWQNYRDEIQKYLDGSQYERFSEKGFVRAVESALLLAENSNISRNWFSLALKLTGIFIRRPSTLFYKAGMKMAIDLTRTFLTFGKG